MDAPNHNLTPTGQIKRQRISQVCKWVKNSWKSVKHETVVKSFKRHGIGNALDGTKDDVLFEESESFDNNNSNNECDISDEDFRGVKRPVETSYCTAIFMSKYNLQI
jgi:hypothetical protein